MRIVILSGTMFPHISARSFRTTELALGLAKMGHSVTLYTILGKYDYSAMIVDCPNLILRDMGRSVFGNVDSDGVQVRNFFTRALSRLLYNIIDYPRCEYFFKALKALKKEEPFDYLITIAHPYGVHWGAAFYKKRHKDHLKFKYWVSDCGDPFLGDPDVPRKKLVLKPLEEFWGRMTDAVAIPVENGRRAYFENVRNKIVVIPQSVDFRSFEIKEYERNEVPTFLYSGAVYPGMRDPSGFLEYLTTLRLDFRFIVYVPSNNIFGRYQERLGEKLIIRPYIPRKELVREMSTMDFLININNDSAVQTPSKLIDYSISQRPILNISSCFSTEEKKSFEAFLEGDYVSAFVVHDVERYNTPNVCAQFIALYEDATK